MAVTETTIGNRGLQILGAARILDFANENTKNARACRACYDQLRRAELRKHQWRFSIKRFSGSPLNTTDPLGDFQYIFQLPADYIQVIKPNTFRLDWQIEGKTLYTNAGNSLKLRYVADITDTSLFDPLFCEMLSAKMGDAMCEEVTQSNAKKAAAKQAYEDAEAEATKANAFEMIPQEAPEDDWVAARILGVSDCQ